MSLEEFKTLKKKKITLIKEKATRYVGQDDNTTGNMLYLCPNHAHSYSKKCVKIVLQLEDGTWKEISDIKKKSIQRNSVSPILE